MDPRKQTYGLAFFLALLLASRARHKVFKALAGIAVLMGLASIGVACEAAIAYAGIVLPAGDHVFVPAVASGTLIALGFQLGTLIFPSVVPVALWALVEGLGRTR